MGRHTLRTRPPSPEPRTHDGHVMLGGVADSHDRRWRHWVRIDAEPVRYHLGTAHKALCGVACVPATAEYLTELQACPDCDHQERGFAHRLTPPCCEEAPR